MNRSFVYSTIVAVVAAATAVGIGAPAAQASMSCTGTMTGVTVSGNLTVPPGTNCILEHVNVTGGITIGTNAGLAFGIADGTAGDTVGGSITGTNIRAFDSFKPTNTVGGSVTLSGVTGNPSTAPKLDLSSRNFFTNFNVGNGVSITNSTPAASEWAVAFDSTGSNVRLASNLGGVELEDSTVHGNASVTGTAGGGDVDGNTINGSLMCSNNSPALTSLSNTVGGIDQGAGGTC